jgi:hypothetical protein
MFAILSAVFFIISVIEHGAGVDAHSAWFDSTGFMLLGLMCVGLHLATGASWPWRK